MHIYLNVSKKDGCDFWQVTAKMNPTMVTNHFPLLERNLMSSQNRICLTSKIVLNVFSIVVKKYVNVVHFISELFMVSSVFRQAPSVLAGYI